MNVIGVIQLRDYKLVFTLAGGWMLYAIEDFSGTPTLIGNDCDKDKPLRVEINGMVVCDTSERYPDCQPYAQRPSGYDLSYVVSLSNDVSRAIELQARMIHSGERYTEEAYAKATRAIDRARETLNSYLIQFIPGKPNVG